VVASLDLGRLAPSRARTRVLRAAEGAPEGDRELWMREPALPLARVVAGLRAGATEKPRA
jgi:hypothetical protein